MRLVVSQTSYPTALGFGMMLLLPSLDIPLKYSGVPGMVAYLVLGVLGILAAYFVLLPRLVEKINERSAAVGLLIMLAVLAIFAIVMYPIANSGRFGGGSDIDDALLIGVNEIFSGRYPYYPRTYLGGLLSPMPGAILLSSPFVLAGLLPLQNIFWLGALGFTARKTFRSSVPALLIILTVMLTSPSAYQVIATGSDHMSNAIYILVAIWLLIGSFSDREHPAWTPLLSALLLGIGLSSRSNFLLLMPLLFSVLYQNAGIVSAIKYCSIAVLTFLAVTMPFWLYDPLAFSPYLIQSGRLENIEHVLPYARLIIPGITLGLAGLLSMTRMQRDGAEFFRNCAIIQLVALFITSLPYAAFLGEFTLFLGSVGYGMFTIFFASVSAWLYIQRQADHPGEMVN